MEEIVREPTRTIVTNRVAVTNLRTVVTNRVASKTCPLEESNKTAMCKAKLDFPES